MLAVLVLTAVLAVLLVIDLAVVRGRGGEMSLRAAAVASAAWVGVALAFFAVLLAAGDGERAGAFLAGYLVEKSLSLDNVFVFLLVLGAFALPVAERHRILSYGIVLALVLRALFIVAGAAALSALSWLSFVFAAFLIWTGWRLFRHRHDHDAEHALVGRLKRWLPFSAPVAALAGIALVDILFAVDSVPAILAITDDTFIVFAANAFALPRAAAAVLPRGRAGRAPLLPQDGAGGAARVHRSEARRGRVRRQDRAGVQPARDRRDPRGGSGRLARAGAAVVEGADRNRTGVNGFAGRCVATPPRRQGGTGYPARGESGGRPA